jgi:hypothetical protein
LSLGNLNGSEDMTEARSDIAYIELAKKFGDAEFHHLVVALIQHGTEISPQLLHRLKAFRETAVEDAFPNGWGNPASPWTDL